MEAHALQLLQQRFAVRSIMMKGMGRMDHLVTTKTTKTTTTRL